MSRQGAAQALDVRNLPWGSAAVWAAARRRRRGGKPSGIAWWRVGSEAHSEQPAPSLLAANALSAVVLALEAVGSLLLWVPIPLAWMWIGAQVYKATGGSLMADCSVALLGFLATTIFTMKALTRLDAVWVRLRQRAGHDQGQGALTGVVVVSATLGLTGFTVWYYLLSDAFIIPFMPNH